MADKLTPKQEAFVLAYIETGNASEAYRRAYNAENMSEKVIHNKASDLLKRGDIRVRVEALQKHHQQRHAVTVDSLTNELIEDRELAHKNEQASAAIAATMGKTRTTRPRVLMAQPRSRDFLNQASSSAKRAAFQLRTAFSPSLSRILLNSSISGEESVLASAMASSYVERSIAA